MEFVIVFIIGLVIGSWLHKKWWQYLDEIEERKRKEKIREITKDYRGRPKPYVNINELKRRYYDRKRL